MPACRVARPRRSHRLPPPSPPPCASCRTPPYLWHLGVSRCQIACACRLGQTSDWCIVVVHAIHGKSNRPPACLPRRGVLSLPTSCRRSSRPSAPLARPPDAMPSSASARCAAEDNHRPARQARGRQRWRVCLQGSLGQIVYCSRVVHLRRPTRFWGRGLGQAGGQQPSATPRVNWPAASAGWGASRRDRHDKGRPWPVGGWGVGARG